MNNEQPVAWTNDYCLELLKEGYEANLWPENEKDVDDIPLYTHPAKTQADIEYEADKAYWRTRIITDEEMLECAESAGCVFDYSYKGEVTFISKDAFKRFVKAILRKAQEK